MCIYNHQSLQSLFSPAGGPHTSGQVKHFEIVFVRSYIPRPNLRKSFLIRLLNNFLFNRFWILSVYNVEAWKCITKSKFIINIIFIETFMDINFMVILFTVIG